MPPSDQLAAFDEEGLREVSEDEYSTFQLAEFSSISGEMDFTLTPYPYATTNEELQEWKQLRLSLGNDWSSRLAGFLSSSELSIDSDQESDFVQDAVPGTSSASPCTKETIQEESIARFGHATDWNLLEEEFLDV